MTMARVQDPMLNKVEPLTLKSKGYKMKDCETKNRSSKNRRPFTLEQFTKKLGNMVLKDFGGEQLCNQIYSCEKSNCDSCDLKSKREFSNVLKVTEVWQSQPGDFEKESFVIDTNLSVSIVIPVQRAKSFRGLDYNLSWRDEYKLIFDWLERKLYLDDRSTLIIPGKTLSRNGSSAQCGHDFFSPGLKEPDKLLIFAKYRDQDELMHWVDSDVMVLDCAESDDQFGRSGHCGLACLMISLHQCDRNPETGAYRMRA